MYSGTLLQGLQTTKSRRVQLDISITSLGICSAKRAALQSKSHIGGGGGGGDVAVTRMS
jgi:hypothetical protein